MILKDSKVKKLTKGEAKDILRNSVFNSTLILERLEAFGKIGHNGYLLRQELVELACSLLDKYWIEE